MAPKTPQGNSKLPKPPSAGGPIPLTGIPAPSSVLQRRSFMPTTGSVSKTFKDMTPEQQALLAEAISMHSPGLIDPARKTAPTAPTSASPGPGARPGLGGPGLSRSPSNNTQAAGMAAAAGTLGFSTTSSLQQPTSPNSNNAGHSSPTGLTSPLSFRASTSQIGRRPSTSRLGMNPSNTESNGLGVHSALSNTSQQFTRPASYSGVSPLSTSTPNLPAASSSPSPTTPGPARPAGSPSGSRPSLLGSRLSAGAGARPATMMKQPLFQRPPGTPATTPGTPSALAGTGPATARNPLSSIPGSPALAPPSLDNYQMGDRVIVESMALTGYLRFLGPTEFKSGTWAGIELDTPTGKNDGSVGGVVYFHCRPKCGIFVLAAKIAKSELLFPSSPELTVVRPPSAQEETTPLPLPTVSHAAQAASRITAGSRASKYIGMTASQLKQRNVMPQPSTTRPTTQTPAPGTSYRASSPTIRSLSGISGSPTTPKNAPAGPHNPRANSPSPIPPKTLMRSASPTTRPTLSARLSQTGAKPTLGSLAAKQGAHSRSTSSTSSVTSQTSATGARARTSPTPARALSTPRRLSSRSDTPDTSLLSPSESRSNLLDQATAVQMASPKDDTSLQLQQLQLDFDVAMAENNVLKTKVDETTSQLETSRLLEKKNLTDEERVYLSKALGREGIDELLGQELEELHAMKDTWQKEKAAKDQEIQVMTEKMTQAWLEAARSQKERTTLIQEKMDLTNKLHEIQTNGGAMAVGDEHDSKGQEHLALIETLKTSLQEADEKTRTLELKLQDLTTRAAEEEDKLTKANAETTAASEALFLEQLAMLEQERDSLKTQLGELEVQAKESAKAMELKLETIVNEAAESRAHLTETMDRLELEAENREQKEAETEAKLKSVEVEWQETKALLAKSEKLTRSLDERVKEYETLVAKRDEQIAGFKLELEDLAGMVQSEEVDRMRKVWEGEKKRLEEAVADNITVMTTLRAEIQTLESNEEDLLSKISTLEKTVTTLTESVSTAESEANELKHKAEEAATLLEKERQDLREKIAASEETLESRLKENQEKLDDLEMIAQSVEEWKERCEAMQFEMIQKTAMVEDVNIHLADAEAQQDVIRQETAMVRKELEEKMAQLAAEHAVVAQKFNAEQSALHEEREQLQAKISELEAALALSASTRTAAPAGTPETVLNRTELEEEIAHLKQMVHDLTRENVTVASVNKKLMQEHDNLMEAHKHVETECLKLMDEVERLHSESLAVEDAHGNEKDELDLLHHGVGQEDLKEALDSVSALSKDTSVVSASEKQNGSTNPSSASVIRLEGLLKEKQSLLDRLTQSHAVEMRELRQRYVDLDRSKSWEVGQLNKELTELESLIESKIFHEADLEEEVQRKQKQIDRLQHEVSDLKNQLSQISKGSNGFSLPPINGSSPLKPSSFSGSNGYSSPDYSRKPPMPVERTRTVTGSTTDTQALFCEICEVEGHDLISCVAVFGASKSGNAAKTPLSNNPAPSAFADAELEDERPYCENCEEFGLHYTDECPNESLTY